MNDDSSVDTALHELARHLDRRADAAERAVFGQLAALLLPRLPPEDMLGRTVSDLHGMLRTLYRYVRQRSAELPAVFLLNPDAARDGWHSDDTVLIALCPGIPFCTASVRSELNRRGIEIHTLASADFGAQRDAAGELLALYVDPQRGGDHAEALLYFEIGRCEDPDELEELRATLVDILTEVSVVVADFPAMRARLLAAADTVRASDCVEQALRDEAVAFLQWLERGHMTLLGYEYLDVPVPGKVDGLHPRPGASLGLLRRRASRGTRELAQDLASLTGDALRAKQLSFSKSDRRSRVHRDTYPDYVEVREYDAGGAVCGQHRFLGLYTFPVYTMDPWEIPILRRKVQRVLELSRSLGSGHQHRELVRVLQLFPRDELFQSSVRELSATVNAVNGIQERRQIRLFVRIDPYGKFATCLLYLPRDNYTTERRQRVQCILVEAFGATDCDFHTFYSESILVRVNFMLRLDPQAPRAVDAAALERRVVAAVLSWDDQLQEALGEAFGEDRGSRLLRQFGRGFSPGYQDDFDVAQAVADLRKLLELQAGAGLAMRLYRLPEDASDALRLRLYHCGDSLPLSDVLPILENLGLRVLTERPYDVDTADGARYWVQEFCLVYALADDIDVQAVRADFEDAFARIWFGVAENDSFNRLLLGTRLDWREIAILRACARYLKQLQFPYSVAYMAETMANHLQLAGALVELFLTRFDPDLDGDAAWRAGREAAVAERIVAALETVPNLGEDRIIRRYLQVIQASVRTNFFQRDAHGEPRPCLALKLRPAEIHDVPPPVPLFEIYVYSPRVEGVHLRGGRVARGGLRWSDRLEDFRTEVLGLVKAQQVKNAVIVPVGAKGGFVARQLRADAPRADQQREAEECYALFIRSLLEVTDNQGADGVVRPPAVIAHDGDDPYLVVAADKGTATFSDLANRIAADYGFWLGDAFASGGSAGYDHKAMGITARGAWVSVERHFRELGVDPRNTVLSVVGIGDMSGDVFGNGMLLSPHLQLVAAFNHQHIFVDPSPEPAASFAERQRLFALPRSSWAQYDPALISAGGGVFERAAKSIALSAEVRARFDIAAEQLTPAELISQLLRAQVDLLWNGGIGTYVKSSRETHAAVGDKANDALRVDARELRCKVVGEGGNLGLTQLARVEYALGGGRCNTDFIDNAGGVDCSDHEVNAKILLNAVVARGELAPAARDALLAQMTDSVAALVLADNYRQTEAISLMERQAAARDGEYRRLIRTLVDAGRLDRELEFLPSDEELDERRAQGRALTRPELAVLLSYGKAALKEELAASDLDDDSSLADACHGAFPPELVTRYAADIRQHRLYREIVATQLANDIVNRMGPSFVLRQRRATGAGDADVARAFSAVLAIYGLPALWAEIQALDYRIDSEVQLDLMLALVALIKRATRWLLRNRRRELSPGAVIDQFQQGLRELRPAYPGLLRGLAAEEYEAQRRRYLEAGVPEALAARVAANRHAYAALGVIAGAQDAGVPLMQLAGVYFQLGERLELDWLGSQILGARVDSEWQGLARDTYLEDLEWQQRSLAISALREGCTGDNADACLARWEAREAPLLARWRSMLVDLHAAPAPDFAMLAVANRELLDLAQSSARAAGQARG